MRSNKYLLRLAVLTTALTLGVGVLVNANISPSKVEAVQHLDNYESYSYSGSYYNSIDFSASQGMNGVLRQSLTELVVPQGFYTYGGTGDDRLSTQLQYCDEDPTNSNNMVYLYTRNSVPKSAAKVDGVDVWNREHVWCQSLSNGNWGTEEGGTDILHLRPVYCSTNSSRNNTPYGDIGKANPKYYDTETGKVTDNNTKMLFGYLNNSFFEPVDASKGDVAREVMYLWLTYTGYVNRKHESYNPLDITTVFQSYDTLLRWHTMDEPDVLEGNRNDYVQTSRQKNRNPFVDHPELAWMIFGTEASNSVREACQAKYPSSAGGEPIEPTGIRLSKATASVEIGKTLQLSAALEPNGASGSITWTSSDETAATVNNSGLVTAVFTGSTTITAKVSDVIKAECVVNVVQPANSTLHFIANLTSEMNVNGEGFNITNNATQKKDGFYQDGGTIGSSICSFSVLKNSALFAFEPSSITVVANLNSANNRNPLNSNVQACLIDSSGNNIEGTTAVLTTLITTTRTDYRVDLPYHSNARGVKIFHPRENGVVIRYYSFSLWSSNRALQPYDLLKSVSPIATIHGNETLNPNTTTLTSTVTFSQRMSNLETVSERFKIGQVSFAAEQGTHQSEAPKYYTNGTALRLYVGNTLTFTNAHNISSIRFTFTSGSNSSVSSEDALLSSSTWNCSSSTIVFNVTQKSRISVIRITYTGDQVDSVDSVALRFGASIPKNDWDGIASRWTISDYGLMLVKEDTLINENKYAESSIEEAHSSEKTLAFIRKGSGETPYLDGENYIFTGVIRITEGSSDYNNVYCGVPFIVVDGSYYFLEELRFSVRKLAKYCYENGGSNFSTATLLYLMGE